MSLFKIPLCFFVAICWIHNTTAQSFSGKITYRIHYDDKKGGDPSTYWGRTFGNLQIFYTDGCNQRTDYLYDDLLLYSTFFDCESSQNYLSYPGVDRVLQHDKYLVDRRMEVVSFEKDVISILGVPCDRLIVNYKGADQRQQIEYFLSQQHQLDKRTLTGSSLEYPQVLAVPLATVGGPAGTFQAAEAVTIKPIDTLSENFFSLPASSTLVLNGAVLDSSVQPEKGYSWWYGKAQSSLRYPRNARRKGLEDIVLIMFTVTKDGTLENIEVINEVDKSLAEQVQRLLTNTSVKWNPGKIDGKPVTSTIVLPVNFRLTP